MGKYGRYGRQVPLKKRPWKIHPIWRGIGCLMFLISPFIAFAAADLLVTMNIEKGWVTVPREMSGSFTLPGEILISNFYATLLVTVVLLLLGFGLLMFMYSLIYAVLGPSRLGPLDSPPVRRSPRRRQ